MLRIVVEIDGDAEPQGAKELLAMELERFGGVRVVDIQKIGQNQMTMEGYHANDGRE